MKKILLILVLFVAFYSSQGQNNGYVSKVANYMILQNDTVRFDESQIDGEVLTRVNGVWKNATGGAGSASVDSLIWDFSDGYLGWYISGSVSDSISLDGRYVEISDTLTSGTYYTQRQVDSLVVNYQSSVFTITLPINGTLSGSVAAAVEGTDYPTGWNLSASAGDLQVGHNLGRYTANVTVSYNTTGDSYRQYRNFADAYSGKLDISNDSLSIESITDDYTAYEIKVFILFE